MTPPGHVSRLQLSPLLRPLVSRDGHDRRAQTLHSFIHGQKSSPGADISSLFMPSPCLPRHSGGHLGLHKCEAAVLLCLNRVGSLRRVAEARKSEGRGEGEGKGEGKSEGEGTKT